MQDDPYSELFGMMRGQMASSAAGAIKDGWVAGELGTMTANLDLKLDRFKHVITDYLISDHLTLAEPDMTHTEQDGAHSQPDAGFGGAHVHQVVTPPQLLPLHPGDRVLVQPVNDGQDFVIVARVKARE